MKTYFISGHLTLSDEEFELNYKPFLDSALEEGASFVVGDACGADKKSQEYLLGKTENVVVYHMFDSSRNNVGFPTIGGFKSDGERDKAMTNASTHDIAWVREGREKSGTQKNLDRRGNGKGCICEMDEKGIDLSKIKEHDPYVETGSYLPFEEDIWSSGDE